MTYLLNRIIQKSFHMKFSKNLANKDMNVLLFAFCSDVRLKEFPGVVLTRFLFSPSLYHQDVT